MGKTTFAIIGVALLITATGCTYVGKHKNLNPVESARWKTSYPDKHFSTVYHDCGNFKVGAEFIPVESYMYTIGFIIPIIPVFGDNGFFYARQDKLAVPLLLDGDQSGVVLTKADFQIDVNNGQIIRNADSVENYGGRHYVLFELLPKDIAGFRLNFLTPIGKCSLQSLTYTMDDIGVTIKALGN